MGDESKLAQLEREIAALTVQQKLELIERIVRQLQQTGFGDEKLGLDWNELYGAGKGLWKGEDAQDYVNRMREDRECPPG